MGNNGKQQQQQQKKKPVFVKKSVENPLMKTKYEVESETAEQIKSSLKACCQGLFSKPVTKKEAAFALKESSPEEFKQKQKDKVVRKAEIKAKQKEMRRAADSTTQDDLESRQKLRVGLKQCLRALNGGDRMHVSAVLFDSDVNFASIKCIFDKGNFPIVGIPQLAAYAKTLLGFPASCLALVSVDDNDRKFGSLVKLLKSTGDFSSPKEKAAKTGISREAAAAPPPAKRQKKSNKENQVEKAKKEKDQEASNSSSNLSASTGTSRIDSEKGAFGDDFIQLS